MIALLAALGFAAVLSLQPWGEDSVDPRVSVAPDLGVALGEAVAVSPERQLAIASARPAPAGETAFVARGVPSGAGSAEMQVGIGPARALMVRPQSPPEELPPPPQPKPVPTPQSTPPPAATPVSFPAPAPAPVATAPTRPGHGGQPTRPGSAGGPGPEGGTVLGPVEIDDGDEYAYSFSFYIQPEAYRAPGEDNLILRFADEAGESHSLGLQLWDDGSDSQRGLWASGDAMGGERFLTPVVEDVWHQMVLYFEASSEDDGLYLLLLDGEPIDTRAWVSLIDAEGDYGLLEAGLFRDGERVDGTPEIFFGPARLSETLESVIP